MGINITLLNDNIYFFCCLFSSKFEFPLRFDVDSGKKEKDVINI